MLPVSNGSGLSLQGLHNLLLPVHHLMAGKDGCALSALRGPMTTEAAIEVNRAETYSVLLIRDGSGLSLQRLHSLLQLSQHQAFLLLALILLAGPHMLYVLLQSCCGGTQLLQLLHEAVQTSY